MQTSHSFTESISERKETKTWCGFPHHLLLPKGRDFNKGDQIKDAQSFLLMVLVNDIEQDVTEGSDRIEHMFCGHKDLRTKLDKRSFGFPFNRDISFNLLDTKNKYDCFEFHILIINR